VSTTFRFYDTGAIGANLKMAVLTGYTFNTSHRNWSDVSAYDIGSTGTYTATGVSLTSSYVDRRLYIDDFGLYFVTASSVSHLVVYNSDTGKLVFAVEHNTAQDWDNSYVTFDWPEYIEFPLIPHAAIRLYPPTQIGNAIKMVILSGYTFSSSHKNFAQISPYDIGATGDYPAGGRPVTFSYSNGKLSVTDFALYLVTAQNVGHLALYNPDTSGLILAVEFNENKNWNNTRVAFDWPTDIDVPSIASRKPRTKKFAIEMER
jgi:hypothetical protein